jgi:hypothetical protein
MKFLKLDNICIKFLTLFIKNVFHFMIFILKSLLRIKCKRIYGRLCKYGIIYFKDFNAYFKAYNF